LIPYRTSSDIWKYGKCKTPRPGRDVKSVETVIGFAFGYWVGTRQGREGMQKALDSAREIWASPETRRLAAEGLSALEALAGPVREKLRHA
jgi:hypothetical protein